MLVLPSKHIILSKKLISCSSTWRNSYRACLHQNKLEFWHHALAIPCFKKSKQEKEEAIRVLFLQLLCPAWSQCISGQIVYQTDRSQWIFYSAELLWLFFRVLNKLTYLIKQHCRTCKKTVFLVPQPSESLLYCSLPLSHRQKQLGPKHM